MKLAVVGVVFLFAGETFALDHKKQPNNLEWKYFFKKGAKFQKTLWESNKKQGVEFNDWSWGWRILWLKGCGLSKEAYCVKILAQGFRDEAMVVRAEAITQLGRRFKGSGNEAILKQLRKAFAEKRNFRHTETMFIHKNILKAMQMIGGKKSDVLRLQLAKRYSLATINDKG